jgi:hypothetical protein
MRRPLRIAIDLVRHGPAAADVVRNVFDVRHRAGAGRNIHRGDVEADPVTRLELVGGRENLDFVLDDFSRLHSLDGIPRKLVERSIFTISLSFTVVKYNIGPHRTSRVCS